MKHRILGHQSQDRSKIVKEASLLIFSRRTAEKTIETAYEWRYGVTMKNEKKEEKRSKEIKIGGVDCKR